MLPLEIALIFAEATMTFRPAYGPRVPSSARPQPLVDPRADRLIRWLLVVNLPPLFFASLGIAIFLSGTASIFVGSVEIAIVVLIAVTQIGLYRRLRRLQRIRREDLVHFQDSWSATFDVEQLIADKMRQVTLCSVFATVPLAAIFLSPTAVTRSAQVLQLIQYFNVGQRYRLPARLAQIYNLLMITVFTTGLAIAPLLTINRHS